MRLTLRTMLCYLDDVLEPADAKEIGAKIEESEYASNVVHRIRTSMRRLRLGAPAVSGKQMGFDPNTVADYLDNTLPPEKVPDFERVCLDTESEAHLAEVAACHQILTLVLGEPAEVSPALREKVYALGRADAKADDKMTAPAEPAALVMPGAEAATPAPAAPAIAPPEDPVAPPVTAPPTDADAHAEVARKERSKPEVPDYLKQGGGRSWWPIAMTLALLLLLAGGALWSTGALDSLFGKRQVADASGDGDNQGGSDTLFNVPDDNNDTTIDEDYINGLVGNDVGEPGNDTPVDKAGGHGTVDSAVRGGSETATDTDDASDSGGGTTVKMPDDLTLTPADGAGGTSTDATVGGAKTPDGGDLSIDGAPKPPSDETPPSDTGEDVAVALPLVDKVMGHYASTGPEVMAYFNEKSGAWMRMPQRTPVKPGSRLVALPTYRPQVLLENKMQMTLAGQASVAFENPVDDVPHVVLHAGRAVVATIGEAGNRLLLRAGDRGLLLTMVDADSAIAVNVHRFHLPGEDPAKTRPHVSVTATVLGGQVECRPADAEAVTLDLGQALTMVDDGIASVNTAADTPKWAKSSDVIDIDRLASATLEPLLDEERPLQVILEEQTGHSRVEVRSLATRCLASVDQFDRIIDTFNDESLKSYWHQHFEQLQRLLALNHETVDALQAAIVRRKGADAERMYRLLYGFSPAQLSAGGDKLLVDYLKHASLDVRVLAYLNLQQITGKTFGYHPHFPEARRRTGLREWEEQAARPGAIAYSDPPPDLPPRK